MRIIRSGLWSTAIVFTIFCYGLGIFSFAFPKQMANFFDSIGNKDLSAVYHARTYEQKQSPENLYYAFEKSIEANNTKYIIKYGEKFFAMPESEIERICRTVDEYLVAQTTDENIISQINTKEWLSRQLQRAINEKR